MKLVRLRAKQSAKLMLVAFQPLAVFLHVARRVDSPKKVLTSILPLCLRPTVILLQLLAKLELSRLTKLVAALPVKVAATMRMKWANCIVFGIEQVGKINKENVSRKR